MSSEEEQQEEQAPDKKPGRALRIGEVAESRFIGNLVRFREALGLTQGAMAAQLREAGVQGMYQTTLSRIEKGERSVKLHEALEIASALHVSVDDMLKPTDSFMLAREAERIAGELEGIEEQLTGIADEIDALLSECRDVVRRASWMREDGASEENPELQRALERLNDFIEGGIDGVWRRASEPMLLPASSDDEGEAPDASAP